MVSDNNIITPKNNETSVSGGENIIKSPTTATMAEIATPEVGPDNVTSAIVNSEKLEIPVAAETTLPQEPAGSQGEEESAVPEDTRPDLVDTEVISGDDQYLGALKKVIREDADEPYREQQNSEQLQKGYLKERFGVDLLMDKEIE